MTNYTRFFFQGLNISAYQISNSFYNPTSIDMIFFLLLLLHIFTYFFHLAHFTYLERRIYNIDKLLFFLSITHCLKISPLLETPIPLFHLQTPKL